jgi:hypothetical protein
MAIRRQYICGVTADSWKLVSFDGLETWKQFQTRWGDYNFNLVSCLFDQDDFMTCTHVWWQRRSQQMFLSFQRNLILYLNNDTHQTDMTYRGKIAASFPDRRPWRF